MLYYCINLQSSVPTINYKKLLNQNYNNIPIYVQCTYCLRHIDYSVGVSVP